MLRESTFLGEISLCHFRLGWVSEGIFFTKTYFFKFEENVNGHCFLNLIRAIKTLDNFFDRLAPKLISILNTLSGLF